LPPKVIEKADIKFNNTDHSFEQSIMMLSPVGSNKKKNLFATITKIASDINTDKYLENLQ